MDVEIERAETVEATSWWILAFGALKRSLPG